MKDKKKNEEDKLDEDKNDERIHREDLDLTVGSKALLLLNYSSF